MCKILPRIKLLAEHEGITIGALERIIGTSKGVLSRAISNGTDIQSKWLQALIENYPQYSAQWLLTGEGDMLKQSNEDTFRNQTIPSGEVHENNIIDASRKFSQRNQDAILGEISHNKGVELRPRIPYDAAAGALSIAEYGISRNDCEMLPVIPRFPKYDFTIIAKGDSMIPEIASGDELACRFIDPKGFIQWGRPHVLDTAQGVVVKNIFELPDSILCRSVNNNYPDFPIAKDDIYHIALVVGLIRQY